MIKLISNIIRSDTKGNGRFGMSRGSRKHNGVDLLCLPGLPIYATKSMKFIRVAYPYADDLKYTGGVWQCDDYEIKIFYCKPITTKHIYEGDVIGHCLNIAEKYSKDMMPHIHVEIRKDGQLIDPTDFLIIK